LIGHQVGLESTPGRGIATPPFEPIHRGQILATFALEGAALRCAFANATTIVAGDDGGRVYLLSLEE